jgi:hypothetical protein
MATITNTTSVRRAPKNVIGRLISVSLLAMLAATAADLGLYYAAGILFPEVTTWPGSGAGQIAGANVVYLLMGAIALAIITRISSRPRRHYLILATVGLLLSLGLPISAGFGFGPPGTPEAGVATVITLSLMHITSFAISVTLFIRMTMD